MASRPFASVAVALDVGGDREELLQVRIQHKHATIHADSKKATVQKRKDKYHYCMEVNTGCTVKSGLFKKVNSRSS